jgi:uncharacterized membrane protein (UPF0127 family)
MNKRTRSIVAIVLLIAFGGWMLLTFLPGPGKKVKSVKTRPGSGTSYEPKFKDEGDLYFIDEQGDTISRLDIELAETDEEINYGMMFRKSMDENTGMLFIRDNERQQSFYMKNTYVSLDIMFIDSDNKVVSIQKNAEPLNEKSLPSEGPAILILETVGGYADKYGIGKGTEIVYSRN